MPTIPIRDIGKIGIVKDIPAHELPPEAWSDGQNVHFRENKVLRILGNSQVFGTPGIAPHWAMNVPTATDVLWLYANATALYATDGTAHADVSNASAYTMSLNRLWSGGILGGIPVITNGVEPPQFWSNPSLSSLLADLTNWPANTLCRDIKPFKNFLVAMDITKSGVRSPHMVKWSHPADPGTLPTSWDETDATKDAGEKELDDVNSGFIIEGLPLRDTFVIYKENSIWGMQFIGGAFIFRFFPIFVTSGILAKHCSVPISNGELHFVATGNDLIVHDVRQAVSVVDKNWRRFINDNINTDEFSKSFVTADYSNNEAWFCFPTGVNTWPNLAIIWNWKDKTVGVRDLSSNISFIAPGIVIGAADPTTWDLDTVVWDSDVTLWDQRPFDALTLSLLMTDLTNTKLYLAEDTNAFDTVAFDSYVERQGLAVIGQDRNGNPKVDFESRKLVKRIWPQGTKGVFAVKVGSQEVIDGTVTWAATQKFTSGVDKYLDFSVSGRLLAVRFEDAAVKGQWEVSGYNLEVEILGAL